MNNRPAAPSFGWNLGIISGLFGALQVLISATTAQANFASIASMRWALSRLQTGGGNPLPLLGSLASVLLVTYVSMMITGAICIGLCWYAGRLTAFARGRHGGARAGFQVALLSGVIWMTSGVIISLLLHSDGTITGVVASTPDGSSLAIQISGLLLQQLIFGAIGLGLGAWAGALGSRSAPLPDTPAETAPAFAAPVAYGMYPAYPAYPPAPGYPVYDDYPPVAPSYPPPPQFYHAAETATDAAHDIATAPSAAPQEPASEPPASE